ncbi:LysR family transcriptional regulator [Vibrio sp. MA40-2]|uniref:LysR family transcriptional regulator n=1 Tax=Vibrio sp. MA40-2 TaxID=3391828 RepID=UPI0039A691FE
MKANYSLDDLRCFCAIAKFGSFKKAAISLNMPLSTLSRRIQQLESDLQLRLLNRDAHRVTLTHIGNQYYHRSFALFDELGKIGQQLHHEKHQLKGKIRITAPIYFGQQFLKSIFYDFLLQYPEIQLDLRFSNNLIDIEEQEIDIAFRIRNRKLENWVIRQLKYTRNILCSHPDLCLDHVQHPNQLHGVEKVVCEKLLPWQLENCATGETYNYQPQQHIRLEIDEVQMMTQAVATGIGISYIPDYLALPMIEEGELKRVLPEWQSAEQSFAMLYRDRENLPLRVKLLVEYVLQRLS